MSEKAGKIFAVIVLAVLAAVAALCYMYFAPGGSEGAKDITVEVIHGDGSVKNFEISTDEEFLRGALEQEGVVSGDESAYGLFVTTVDGETANSSAREWWCMTRGGETLMTGVDDTPISDGEKYEFALTSGW